ncbi:MAG TPA: radical SAM protein [Fimbriimonas sp.]|nr:radical SAM protein [Fimbriimonas sp.]
MPLPLRDYRIEEYTRTVCPACFEERKVRADDPNAFVDGMLVGHSGSIWLRRFCAKHGETESLYEEDEAIWKSRFGWATPTSTIIPDRDNNFAGFPLGYRDGLPASHGQHSCILVLNVTEYCNYSCPTCYASALAPGTPAQAEESPSLKQILYTVDTVIAREQGTLGVVMLSGGEPTVRRDIVELIRELAQRPITRIMLNTNGRRIARDDRFLKELETHKSRLEVYLQFDGLTDPIYQELRGEEVFAEKQLTLSRLQSAGIFTTLVMTVKEGVNEHQVGDVLQLGMSMPRCSGAAIQPVFGSGRNSGINPMSRTTPTGVLKRLSEQTNGAIKADDFVPLPCSHKDCCDIGYFVRPGNDGWKSLTDLVGREKMKEWIHLVSNSITFEQTGKAVKEMIKDGTLQRIFSEQQAPNSLKLAKDLFSMCGCVPGLTETISILWDREKQIEKLAERTFRVTVKMFMDAHTFHEARIRQCCVHVGTFEEDPRRHSFCWRWLFDDATDFPQRVADNPLRVLQ